MLLLARDHKLARLLGKFPWRFILRTISVTTVLQFCLTTIALLMLKIVGIAFTDLFGDGTMIWNSLFVRNSETGFGAYREMVVDDGLYVADQLTETVLSVRDECEDVSSYDALMVVHSANHHFQRRREYRDTYGNPEFTHPYRIRVVFFVGLSTDPQLTADLRMENDLKGDTVLISHVDHYRNLTLKAVGVYRWLAESCRGAKVVLKIDDDVLLDVHRFFQEFWPPPAHQQDVIFCHVWPYPEVEREGKWGVPYKEFQGNVFPPYCSGFLVVVMPHLVEDIYQVARATQYLWLDDVFIYGLVREELEFVQLINLDHLAYDVKAFSHCTRRYGYRCKYWAVVLGPGEDFLAASIHTQALRSRAIAGDEG
ncbi:beta-1,3-galactosyltransferase 1 [Aplysia californica]|uniref:Hexosyltransferase n=1 Tax=Aplysia californica TaxID=6500 RepID=A0ABM0K212_APLCA|nr:beta-1,3-galactosyltransferase 1 [Aplysia californica]